MERRRKNSYTKILIILRPTTIDQERIPYPPSRSLFTENRHPRDKSTQNTQNDNKACFAFYANYLNLRKHSAGIKGAGRELTAKLKSRTFNKDQTQNSTPSRQKSLQPIISHERLNGIQEHAREIPLAYSSVKILQSRDSRPKTVGISTREMTWEAKAKSI